MEEKILNNDDKKLINDILNFAIDFEYCDYMTYDDNYTDEEDIKKLTKTNIENILKKLKLI